MTMQLEDKLWSGSVTDASEWVDVAHYLVGRLELRVGHRVEIDRITPHDTSSFFCAVYRRTENASPLSIAWRGFFGVDCRHAAPLSSVSLTIVPFLLGQRLKVGDFASSTIELSYERRSGTAGQWTCVGWANDDYGEWEAVSLI